MVLRWWIKLNGNVVKLVSVITIGDLRKPHTVHFLVGAFPHGYDTKGGFHVLISDAEKQNVV